MAINYRLNVTSINFIRVLNELHFLVLESYLLIFYLKKYDLPIMKMGGYVIYV